VDENAVFQDQRHLLAALLRRTGRKIRKESVHVGHGATVAKPFIVCAVLGVGPNGLGHARLFFVA
jgi:hypothetical protein